MRVDEFRAHSDGISCMEFSNNKLFSGSFDHSIKYWDIKEMRSRIIEREQMRMEDEFSKGYHCYNKLMKRKGRKGKKGRRGGGRGKKKKR